MTAPRKAKESAAKAAEPTSARKRISRANTMQVRLPLIGPTRLPRPEYLVYIGGLGALAALEMIEWPFALALSAGHLLAANHHSRVAQELGAALEEA